MASFSAQSRIIALPWLLLAIIVGSICAIEEGNGSIKEANQREFDYFALALQWPGTYCRRSRHCCSTNACCRGSNAPTEFTIHGLWPDYNDGTWPSCCSGPNFDTKKISTLTNALEQYWPSLSCGSPTTCHGTRGSFWAHEWEKHGTCSFPVIHDEYNFFLIGLNLYFKYNVTRVLNEAGYVPSNREKYPLGGIVSAIENAFHISPQVICSGGAVEEIRLCFYKDFKPRDCVVASDIKIDMVTSKSSCPKYVRLPVHVSSGETLFRVPLLVNVALVAFMLIFLLGITDRPLQWIKFEKKSFIFKEFQFLEMGGPQGWFLDNEAL